jgi:hypothetical protein
MASGRSAVCAVIIIIAATLLNLHMHLLQGSAADLLAPQAEGLCGGSLHEDVIPILQDELRKADMYDVLEWYLELKKYGNHHLLV